MTVISADLTTAMLCSCILLHCMALLTADTYKSVIVDCLGKPNYLFYHTSILCISLFMFCLMFLLIFICLFRAENIADFNLRPTVPSSAGQLIIIIKATSTCYILCFYHFTFCLILQKALTFSKQWHLPLSLMPVLWKKKAFIVITEAVCWSKVPLIICVCFLESLNRGSEQPRVGFEEQRILLTLLSNTHIFLCLSGQCFLQEEGTLIFSWSLIISKAHSSFVSFITQIDSRVGQAAYSCRQQSRNMEVMSPLSSPNSCTYLCVSHETHW